MSKVLIAQALCPKRHCLFATASDNCTAEELEQVLREKVKHLITEAGLMNPWCGICYAAISTWSYEVGVTKFETLEEALPHLQREEAKQMAGRAAIEQERRDASRN